MIPGTAEDGGGDQSSFSDLASISTVTLDGLFSGAKRENNLMFTLEQHIIGGKFQTILRKT